MIGLDSITGLQTVRLLADRGVPVIALAGDRRHFACRTRVCDRIVICPTGGKGLIRTLERLRTTLDGEPVLMPCTDDAVLSLSRSRDRLSGFRYALPDGEVVEMLMDKARFQRYAEQHGFPVPRTFILASRHDALDAAQELAYPAILKPSAKTSRWLEHSAQKAYLCHDATQLVEVYERTCSWVDSVVVQEWIPGPESNHFTCNCYYDRASVPQVTFVSRKLRQWPPRVGTGCLSEEVRNDAVLDETFRLFGGLGYRGFGYLEMKADARTGRHYIVEPNIGRPTGRSAIAEAGGVELIYTAYCDLAGLPLPERRTQTYGDAKWIYARQDVQAAIHQWRNGELQLRPWWRSVSGRKVDAVLSWTDPLPFAADLLRTAGRLVARRGRWRRDLEEIHVGDDRGA